MNRRNRAHPADGVAFPDHVSDILSSVAASMSLDRIVVHEMSLDLSLRSSTKLYIALDHSPLKVNLQVAFHGRQSSITASVHKDSKQPDNSIRNR